MPAPAKKPPAPRPHLAAHGDEMLKQSIPAIKDLALALLQDKGAPFHIRALVVFGAIVPIVAVGMGGVLIATQNPGYGFTLALVAIAFMVIVIFVLTRMVEAGFRATAPAPAPESLARSIPGATWTRIVPTLPISEDILNQVRERLEALRSSVYFELQAIRPSLKPENIRANVFLPDTNAVATEGVCELYIPKKLHVGMDALSESDRDRAERERNIRFKPNQGATGIVFTENRYHAARAIESGEEDYKWDERYSLTDTQKKDMHPDLKWVLSFPLTIQDGELPRAMGVVNIDGLGYLPKDDQLKGLVPNALMKVALISGLLAGGPKSRVAVTIEDL